MKRLLFLMLLAPLTFGQTIDTVRTTDTPNQGRLRWNNAINRMAPVFNVKLGPFNAKGDGSADDRAAIQAAADSAALVGGRVFIPDGTFLITAIEHPNVPGNQVCIYLKSNVTLEGAGTGRTIIKRDANTPVVAQVIMNYNGNLVSQGGDSNIVIRDLTIDGNGANNPVGALQAQYGIGFYWVQDALVENVKIVDIRGSATGGGGESFSFEAGRSRRITYINCVAEGKSYSGSGFSANNSQFIDYIGCRGYSFGFVSGFTNYNCSQVTYTNCYAWGNAYGGFNSEYSGTVLYNSCVSGGKTPNEPYQLWGIDSTLGGQNHGFVISGNVGAVSLTNCVGFGNINNGLQTTQAAGNPGSLSVNGGIWSHNGGYGIAMQDTAGRYIITGQPIIDSNDTYPVLFHGVRPYYPPLGTTVQPSGGTLFFWPSTEGYMLVSDAAGSFQAQSYPPAKTYSLRSGNGWYRILDSLPYFSGRLKIFVPQTASVRVTEWEAYVSANGYVPTNDPTLTVVKNLFYNLNHIDSVRIGLDSAYRPFFDVKFASLDNPTSVTIAKDGAMTFHDTLLFNPPTPLFVGLSYPGSKIGQATGGIYFRPRIQAPKLELAAKILADSSLGVAGIDPDSSVTGTGAHFTQGLKVGGDATVGGDLTAGNTVSLTWNWGAFASSTRVAIYLPGTESTDKYVVGWQPTNDTTAVGGGAIWAFTKTDSLIVRCDSTCSTQFTYIGPK